MDKKNKTLALVNEVMTAYSDCNGHKGERNLSYIASAPVDANELIKLMQSAVPEGYNGFEATTSIPQVVKFFGDKAEYFIAREGSVCLYIKPIHNLWFNRREERNINDIQADEILWCPEKQMFRVWWD